MHKKGEVTIQGFLIGTLTVGLLFTLFATIIGIFGANYDITGYNATEISTYSGAMENISSVVESAKADVDKAAVDPSWYDFFSGIWNKVMTPFKFIYRSYTVTKSMATGVTRDLGLLKPIQDYVATLIVILVIIGIVMIKFYLGRRK